MKILRITPAPKKHLLAEEFWPGVFDSLPVTVGLIPIGFTCGVMGLTAGMTSLETISMSVFVFAGAAQFISITMLGAGITSFSLIVLTTLLINLRHLMMGASLATYMARLTLPQKALLAFGIIDESYALLMERVRQKEYSPYYQLGCSVPLYIIWIMSTAVGVFMGDRITDPLAWGLDFALPAMFLALLIPRLVDKASFCVFVVSSLVTVAGALYLPGKWYIIIACLVASITGGILEGESNNAR